MQKIEVTKRIADTGAMAIVRVEDGRERIRDRSGMPGRWNRLSGDQLYPSGMQVR